MKIEEKFNKRDAKLIEVQPPTHHVGPHYALGIRLTFYTLAGSDDMRTIAMHLTPDEALQMAEGLIASVRQAQRG